MFFYVANKCNLSKAESFSLYWYDYIMGSKNANRYKTVKKPASLFKKALIKLKKCKGEKSQCSLIKNSSDEFVRDLALVIHKCLPIYKPLLNGASFNTIKSFSNPSRSNTHRRKMIQHGGGKFVNMLNDFQKSVGNLINSPIGTALLTELIL